MIKVTPGGEIEVSEFGGREFGEAYDLFGVKAEEVWDLIRKMVRSNHPNIVEGYDVRGVGGAWPYCRCGTAPSLTALELIDSDTYENTFADMDESGEWIIFWKEYAQD